MMTMREREMKIEEEGLDFWLDHFEEPTYDDRKISTFVMGKGGGKEQRFIQLNTSLNNKQVILAWYRASNLLDCRISAYPKYTNSYISSTGIAPSLLHVDIDRRQFETVELFELAVTKTYSNFEDILHSKPTQLWTGRGVHFVQPQSVPVFEKLDDFRKFDQPSRKFLHFEEQLLTDGRGDPSHWSTVSFNNCMLRVPWSLNSRCVQFDDKDKIIAYTT